ncbi:hypothetical protein [Sediminitomix flava]|uniref:Uncharacterized protein n=1 Tax=Sediminitomix flava TaxID=379075 RepID=A0A315YVF7_SEDFL|nr:hypothetical protein [Sediminitomix flava]PWJ33502.1 hypothetical protein BC781_1134 [Sediminitomix flava]
MNRNKLIDFKNYEYAFNTSETYSMNAYLSGDDLLIPYLNSQISDQNPFEIKVGFKIDYSYLLLSGISKIQWNGGFYHGENIIGRLIVNNHRSNDFTDYFGFNRRNDSYEIKASFKKIEVFLPSESKVSNGEWIPWDTPNFKQNLRSSEIQKFFEAQELPRLIDDRFNRENSIELVFKNSERGVIKEIISKW